MSRPQPHEYGAFYKHYIDLTTGTNCLDVLEKSMEPLQEWLGGLPEDKIGYAYAPGKWTVAQVLQHMIDTERVFAYRAMCIGRGEKKALPGFDENDYATAAPAAGRKLKGLREEMLTLRKASIILFRSLQKEEALGNMGTASELPASVNALGYIMVGHVLHHIHIIKERYLNPK